MDQGLAAVLGASVGVLGTLGTAIATYAATRRQVVDQERAARKREHRIERRDAYLDFLVATESLDRALHKVAHRDDDPSGLSMESPPSAAVIQSALEDLDVAVHELYKMHMRIRLVGPKRLNEPAIEVWAAARTFRSFLGKVLRGEIPAERYQERCEAAVDYVERWMDRFSTDAGEVLDKSI